MKEQIKKALWERVKSAYPIGTSKHTNALLEEDFDSFIEGVVKICTAPAVNVSLPSKDEVVGRGFNNANGSEYNRRNVLRDADNDLYYTGWMDCFDWLVDNDL